jgi:DNA-directed RNA polymerase specialized sigma24 family protein
MRRPASSPVARLNREDEAELVRQAQSGDEVAFERLRYAHQDWLLSYIRRRVGGSDIVAERIAERTWWRAMKELPKLAPGKWAYNTVLWRTAYRQIDEYYNRDAQRAREISLEALPGLNRNGHDDQWQPDCLLDLLMAETQDDPPVEPEEYLWFLRTTFAIGGYPWQLLTFGFVNLLGWKPGRVASELSDSDLNSLEESFETRYCEKSCLLTAQLRECLLALRKTMSMLVIAVLSKTDKASRQRLERILTRMVGQTLLCDYYVRRERAAAMMSDWIDKVEVRVFKAAVRAGRIPPRFSETARVKRGRNDRTH